MAEVDTMLRAYSLILQNSASKSRHIYFNQRDTSENSLFYEFDSLNALIDEVGELQTGEYQYWLIPGDLPHLTDNVDIENATITRGALTLRIGDICVARGIVKYDAGEDAETNVLTQTTEYEYYE